MGRATRTNPSAAPRLTIRVEQEHIDSALPKDSSHCMIAEAIMSTLPDARNVAVDLATIRYTDTTTGHRYIYLTPRCAQVALLEFDQGEAPQPFRFQVRASQVIPSGRGKKARYTPKSMATPPNNSEVPIVVGGQPIPRGALGSGGTGTGSGSGRAKADSVATARRTGKKRAFGLRSMG